MKRVISPFTLLLSRFPELPQWADEELDPDEPYYAYDRFAVEVRKRLDDPPVFQATCRFIDELAGSGDPYLENLLVVSVLETLAEEATVASKIRPCIGPVARSWLRKVEEDFYGRGDSPK